MLIARLVLGAVLCAGDVESNDAARLEERVLEQRYSLKSGNVSLYFHRVDLGVRGKIEFTFEADNCRMVTPIDPNIFTLKGLDLPVGTRVIVKPPLANR